MIHLGRRGTSSKGDDVPQQNRPVTRLLPAVPSYFGWFRSWTEQPVHGSAGARLANARDRDVQNRIERTDALLRILCADEVVISVVIVDPESGVEVYAR